ncbi:MAG: ImmA/IrrE family metallo-endopeptidase [Candidatus Pseudoruminococcus sp.]|uniref:ImmA/IrrE family metallo-endopeptidase n=1 Tax=Candidatus Pseudoruminococcus sp. TaxID=3101048 RepID=UPI002A78C50A|nr:ImmA/IrrE family metallo-endopeptidase [Ruminococcus sp.]MDY2783614.1 ImmA/IrrE family metallo-endopeptidase [Candidatus Pseudoruminococcus sp.]
MASYSLYGKYKNVRDSSWQSLIDFNVMKLPVSVNEITRQLGIKVIRNSQIHKLRNNQRGFTAYDGNNWYIVFDDTEPIQECRFTVAHELGHILLGHMLVNDIKYRTFEKRDKEEQEADMFATRLLAPACVLHELHATTAEQIAEICNISISAATTRAKRMKVLEKRNKYYLNPLELQVEQKFDIFIKEYLSNK